TTATHIGIREAEDWFSPIDLAKECDIYISSRSGSRVLMPDGTDKDQDRKINDSVHPTVLSSSQNHAMPVKHNVFLLNLPDVEESLSVPSCLYVSDSPLVSMKKKKEYVPLRTAYSRAGRCGIQPKASSLRAQAQLSETETNFDFGKREERERLRCASRRYRQHITKTYLLE
ncbi:hypothetical protein TNCV_3624641, partial [Trichonephila clavipes]